MSEPIVEEKKPVQVEPTGDINPAGEMTPLSVSPEIAGIASVRDGLHAERTVQKSLKGSGAFLTGSETPVNHTGLLDHTRFEEPTGDTNNASTWLGLENKKRQEKEAGNAV